MHDFYSDTKTKPTMAMRESVLQADVGDEQKDEDPTTLELCDRVAALLGKEAAIFLPSGTMCNEIALRVHTRPGDEVICERSCHIIGFETGGPAAISGVMMHPIDGVNGIFESDQVVQAIRPSSRYMPETRLVCVEQTANMGGGAVWPLDKIRKVAAAAKDAGIATHMDGARLLNAAVKSGIPAKEWAEGFDSCWIDFPRVWARRSVRCWPDRPTSSRGRGVSSNRSAGPCGSPASLRRCACTRSITMWIALRTIIVWRRRLPTELPS